MRVLILFTLLVFCSNLWAQSASDHKPACEGAVDLTIDLQQPWNKTSGTALPKISGTNVNVDVHYAATLTGPSTVTWSELKVWIGSQLLALPNGWEQGTIRFASTYFPDSVEDLAFRVSVNYVVHNPVTNCSENGTLDATLHLDPYNKSLNWGTRLNRYDQLWIPFVQDSTLGTSQGGAKLNEMGHTCLPSAGGNPCLNYSITQMMADAAIGTCLLTFAHGNPGVTHDSFNEVVMFQDWNTAMDSFDDVVGPAVEAGFPRWNLAILKSCSVLAYGNDPRPGLRMSDPGDLWRDRAVLGFEKDVYVYLKLGDATDPIQTSQ
ncbi:MAG: hypothetical protein JNM34_02580, partial [Chthonomonadaceae bacterium]|nr:hypothetical protein [Chthonomonadaceae bacterium]